METRFGHDFSRVRVHADSRAAESAQAVHARAYTVGRHVVFNRGQYAPSSEPGRKSLVHELAHVVQQGDRDVPGSRSLAIGHPGSLFEREAHRAAAGSENVRPGAFTRSPIQLQRQLLTPPPQGGGFSGVVQRDRRAALEGEPAPDRASESTREAEGEEGSTGTAPDLSTSARRMVISCTDDLLLIETFTSILFYRLTECDIPLGSYPTTVRKNHTVDGETFDIFWDFGEAVPSDQNFRFSYGVRSDQLDPADLFDEGQNVVIDVVPSLDSPAPSPEAPSGCAIRVPDEVLIPRTTIDRELFEPLTIEETVWTQTIPLGHFGWADLNLVADGSATGMLLGGYGPGMLRDICLLRTLDDRRVAAQARFTLDGRIGPEITLDGGLELEARYLTLIPAGSIRGELQGTGRAEVHGNLDARLEAIYDHVSNEWSLVGDLLISGGIGLRFTLDARAAVTFLGGEIWSEGWPLADERIDFGWAGGLRVGPGREVHFIEGRMAQGLTAADAPSATSAGDGGFTLPLGDLLRALLEHDPDNAEGTAEVLTGRTRRDPIPMIWYKPENQYPRAVILEGEEVFRFGEAPREYTLPDPDVVTRGGRGAADLRRILGPGATVEVGVTPDLIPTQARVDALDPGLVWQKNRSYRRALGGSTQRAFRFLLIQHGHDMGARNEDADHVRDLQFAGPDDMNNMWPLAATVNQSSRAFGRQEVRYASDDGTVITTQLDDSSLLGRYFRIVGFDLF